MSSSDQTFEVNSWAGGLVTGKPVRELVEDRQAKFVVIGAGFSGVAAARRLATLFPDEQVLVVESRAIGDGSSSRSSGFVVSLGQFEKVSSPENRRFYEHGLTAINELRALSSQHNIDCDWLEGGRVATARSSPANRSLMRMERVLSKLGSPFEKLSGDEIQDQTGMSGYVSGIRQVESVMVNPAKLLTGLVRSLPPNVEVYQESPVDSLERASNKDKIRVQTDKGMIETQNVLITSNAFCLQLGYGFNRVFPMRTFVSVAKVTGKTGLGNDAAWGVTSTERIGSSLRRVGDRLFIRNSAFYGFESEGRRRDQLGRISELQRDSIGRRFPGATVEIENTWSGVIGITRNGGQIFRQVDEGVYLSTGYNGHGIAQGTTSGRLLADLATGIDSEELQEIMKVKKPSWLPAGIKLRTGVAACCKYLEWRYRDEI